MALFVVVVLVIVIGISLLKAVVDTDENTSADNSKIPMENQNSDYQRYLLKDYYKPQSSRSSENKENFTYEDLLKFNEYGIVPIHIYTEMQKAILKGQKSILVPKGTKNNLGKERLRIISENSKLCKIADLNNKGIELEKEGRIEEAINTYEENIATSNYPAHHSYKRLMIIYRRNKDFVNELRIINRALEVFPEYDEYVKRRERTLLLMKR